MSEDNGALLVINYTQRTVSPTSAAKSAIFAAVSHSEVIQQVQDESENALAVQAHLGLRRISADIEKARKKCKEPVLELSRRIDGLAKELADELNPETIRVGRLLGDYQAVLVAQRNAAEALRQKEIDEIERKKHEAIAQAKTPDEVTAIREHASLQHESVKVVEPPKPVAGQIVREEWNVVVSDIWALARAHPACVKIEARLTEVKALLNAGMKVAGVTATKQVVSTTRLGSSKQIEV